MNCRNCRKRKHCIERSRGYPCISYKKEGEKNESDRYDRHPKKSNSDS